MWQQSAPTRQIPVATTGTGGPEALPATVLDLHPRSIISFGNERDVDLGGVRPVLAQVPLVDEATRWIPDHDLTPVELIAGGRPFEDPAALPRLKYHLEPRLRRHAVAYGPPAGGSSGPDREC